jgi:hypothetical protein
MIKGAAPMNATQKHTPGPWRWEAGKNMPGYFHIYGDTTLVCDMQDINSELALETDPEPGECAANAKLIAAAPDMLAALRRCLNFIENTEGEHNVELDCGQLARAAIAAAEGRT